MAATRHRTDRPVGGAQPPTYEVITPELAADWLEQNLAEGHNRSLRAARAEGFARDMAAGEWHDNGETIKFDWNGRLIDGQHRLAAIVKYGHPITMLVVRGVAPDAITTIDMGVARRYADVLKIKGISGGQPMAAMERRLYLWLKLGVKAKSGKAADRAPTIKELEDYRPNYGQLLGTALARAKDMKKKIPKVSVATFGTAYVLFASVDIEAADKFWDLLMTGAIPQHRSPVLLLRDKLLDSGGNLAARRTSEDEKLALIIRAWNHWRDGSTVSQLVITASGKPLTDETFPEPK